MKLKIYYDEYQMHDAVKFLAEKNTFFKGRHDHIRTRIIETMVEIAKNKKTQSIYTMGFLVKVASSTKEGFEHDESSITFDIYVDPSVGCMDFDQRCEEIDV